MMAKLAHPNVVAVFDVGTREGRTFLAMEFVRGRSLVEWLATKRPWPEVVAVIRDVARGLAAAHAARIVHRDVKPGNILVGDDGRARITDFGVSRTEGHPTQVPVAAGTKSGFIGSPAYMAPEQLRAEHVDTRADQFGMCVTLHEALTGERPFQGDTIEDLHASIERGAPPISDVPDWLAAIVSRGLAIDPSDRYATTDELATALEGPAPSKLRRRAGWVAAAAMAIAVPAILLVASHPTSEEPIACDVEARGAFADTWTPARRAALLDTFAKSGEAGAAAAGRAIADVADRLSQAWVARWETTCRAARVEHTWPEDLGVQSTTCLDENRVKLRALLAALERADTVAIASGAELLRRSDAVTPCGDPDYLRARIVPPRNPARAAEIAALEARVTALQVAFGLRRHDESKRDFPALMAEVERVGDPRLLAQLLGFEAILAQQRSDLPAAIAAAKRAYLVARRHRDVEAAAQAASDLVWFYGYEEGNVEAGEDWAALALVEIESIPHARVAFRVYSSIGSMAEHRGQVARAVEAQRKAATLIEHYYGADHYSTALAHQNLATALDIAGERAEAIAMYRSSLAILERDLGESSLAYAHALNYFAFMLGSAGEHVEARAVASRSVALGRALDARGADLGALLFHQASVQQLAGDLESAIPIFVEAHAAYVASGDDGHAASTIGALGGARAELALLGDAHSLDTLAIADLERAIVDIETLWGADHPDRATALYSLSLLHAERARCDEATALAKKSHAIFAREPGSALTGDPLTVLGRCMLARGARTEAIATFESALAVLSNERDPVRRAVVEAWLGFALLGTEQTDRAHALLLPARERLAADARHDKLVERIDRALASVNPSRP